jgi:hypothetical protein
MTRARRVLAAGMAAGLAAIAGCEAGPAVLEVDRALLDFGEVDPAAGARTLVLHVFNSGGEAATVSSAGLEVRLAGCGALSLEGGDGSVELGGGEELALTVRFDPDPANPGGCACAGAGEVRVAMDREPWFFSVPVVVRAACDSPVRCVPGAVDFGQAFLGRKESATVTCANVGPVPAVLESLAAARPFGLGKGAPPTPWDLGPAEAIAFAVEYGPREAGDSAGVLEVASSADTGGGTLEIPLSGTGVRAYPACSEGIPADPDPVLEAKGWTIVLETPIPSEYVGTVRSRWYYGDQPPLISDVLVASGELAEAGCQAGQDGHMAWWRDCQPGPDDLFANLHVIPFDDDIDTWIRRIAVWDRVTIRGYEVLKVTYPDGSTWQDAGCNTLIVTWVCATDE